jgi:hypothetical protein
VSTQNDAQFDDRRKFNKCRVADSEWVSDAPKDEDMRCEKRKLLCPDKMRVVYAPWYAFLQQMIVL